MRARHRIRALSLIEVLLAVVFLGICASSILTCVTATTQKMREVEQRAVVLAHCQALVESLSSSSRRAVPSPLNSTTGITLNGIPDAVTVTRKVQPVVGTSDLFLVEVIATWNRPTFAKTMPAQTLRLTTYVRSPYG
jgi:Tfp pilus assembly protein PilV